MKKLLCLLLLIILPVKADVLLGKKIDLKDFSGYQVPKDTILDLGGETIVITKTITLSAGSQIQNGTIEGPDLPDHFGVITVPAGADDCKITNIHASGGSYNGLAVVLGERCQIKDCEVEEGTGWGVKLLEGDQAVIDGLKTLNLRRGGIYVGDGEKDDDNFTDDVEIKNCTLDGADEEAVLRLNNAANVNVHDNTFINTRSSSKKEAVQLRGGSGLLLRNNILGSVATGQTPVGRPILATFTIQDCLIYGYILSQAGSDIKIERGQIVMTKTYSFQGTTYKLANGGGGYALSAKGKTNLLPAAKLVATKTTIIGAEHTTGGGAKTVNVTIKK